MARPCGEDSIDIPNPGAPGPLYGAPPQILALHNGASVWAAMYAYVYWVRYQLVCETLEREARDAPIEWAFYASSLVVRGPARARRAALKRARALIYEYLRPHRIVEELQYVHMSLDFVAREMRDAHIAVTKYGREEVPA